MTVASLPRCLRCRREPNIAAILLAVSRHRPSSQLRSNSLWMGKLRLKMKIGIGGRLTTPPLPHHRTYGSVYGGSVNYAVCGHEGRKTECSKEGGWECN